MVARNLIMHEGYFRRDAVATRRGFGYPQATSQKREVAHPADCAGADAEALSVRRGRLRGHARAHSFNPDHAPEVQQHYLVMVIRSERLDVLWMKI